MYVLVHIGDISTPFCSGEVNLSSDYGAGMLLGQFFGTGREIRVLGTKDPELLHFPSAWWFGTMEFYDFPYSLEHDFFPIYWEFHFIPTDFHSIIFQRGRRKTTNQSSIIPPKDRTVNHYFTRILLFYSFGVYYIYMYRFVYYMYIYICIYIYVYVYIYMYIYIYISMYIYIYIHRYIYIQRNG